MENPATRQLKRWLVRVAWIGLPMLGGCEWRILALKEPGRWCSAHVLGELALAMFPNLIAGLVAFLIVYYFIERRDERKRYIAAMRAIRAAVGKTNLEEAQIQELMVVMVKEISLLYFQDDKPRASDQESDKLPCTLCPKSTREQKLGRCEKCNEIPECWSVEDKTHPG